METVKTQFKMSGVLTYVTIQKLPEDTYACILNLVDFFEGGEQPVDLQESDMRLKRDETGQWVMLENSKVHLEAEDLQRLGEAIEESL
ncbi:MAG: hypothetical protein WKF66_06515 [Pedobacter sp.]